MNRFRLHPAVFIGLIVALSVAMHARVFRLDLIGFHAWRQTETQTVIDNFVRQDFNILNPRTNDLRFPGGILRMEFPIMQWLFAAAYRISGVHGIALSRALTFLLSALSAWGMHRLARRSLGDARVAGAVAWYWAFSPVLFYYAVNPLPDNFALCTAVWSMTCFWEWTSTGRERYLVASAALLGLAAAAKLPFVLYASFPFTWILLEAARARGRSVLRPILAMGCYLVLLLPAAAWYVWVVPTWKGNGIVTGALDLQGMGLRDLLALAGYHLTSMLPENLLGYAAVPVFVAGCYYGCRGWRRRGIAFSALAVLGIGVLCYFLFELNMIGKMHDYYMMPFLPPLALILGYGAARLWAGPAWGKRMVIVCLALLPLTTSLRMRTRWNEASPGFNAGLWKYRAELRAATPPAARCIVGNDLSHYLWFYHLDRQGWAFAQDEISPTAARGMVEAGARYLYTDSDAAERTLQPLEDSLILRRGTIRVYRLRVP